MVWVESIVPFRLPGGGRFGKVIECGTGFALCRGFLRATCSEAAPGGERDRGLAYWLVQNPSLDPVGTGGGDITATWMQTLSRTQSDQSPNVASRTCRTSPAVLVNVPVQTGGPPEVLTTRYVP